MIQYSFFESITGNIKQKRKSTREPQLSANSRAARKRAKQDAVHGMVVTSLGSKTRGDVYGNLKKIIDDATAVRPWMKEDRLKCALIRHNQKISNNQLLDKEEAETDKSEHQTSVLGLIFTITVSGGRPKGSTSEREWVKGISISLVCSTVRQTWNIVQRTDLSSHL